VITRIATLSDAIGCRGFYEHLLLLLKDIRRTPSGSGPPAGQDP
jgi:hypothetical protein